MALNLSNFLLVKSTTTGDDAVVVARDLGRNLAAALAVQQAIGLPIARRAAAAWLLDFVRDIKHSRVAELIQRHGVVGVSVAPPA